MLRSMRLLHASLRSGVNLTFPSSSRLASSQMPELQRDNVNKRFYIELNLDKATIDYELIDSNTLDLQHTNVPNSLQGKGVGKIIAKEVFEYCKTNGIKMKLTCEFLQKFYEDNKNDYTTSII
ncbi:hypothetical protein R5R35_004517 [Gryllus longicercus]|uniref:Protein NATD1 n=1 Tax=Gryllus longicercus TaxID=2509291 RepID=A0AAN9VXZ4_9ORTH